MVFLCSFFFLLSGLVCPKIFKFLIYILMLIFGDLGKLLSPRVLGYIFWMRSCLEMRIYFD